MQTKSNTQGSQIGLRNTLDNHATATWPLVVEKRAEQHSASGLELVRISDYGVCGRRPAQDACWRPRDHRPVRGVC